MTKQELERVRDCLLRAGREMGMEDGSYGTVEVTLYVAMNHILSEFLGEEDCSVSQELLKPFD